MLQEELVKYGRQLRTIAEQVSRLSHHTESRQTEQGAKANFTRQEVMQAWGTLRCEGKAEVQASQQSEHAAAAAYQDMLVAAMSQEQATMQNRSFEREEFLMLDADTHGKQRSEED